MTDLWNPLHPYPAPILNDDVGRKYSVALCGLPRCLEHHHPSFEERGGTGRGQRAGLDAVTQGLCVRSECSGEKTTRVSRFSADLAVTVVNGTVDG